MWIVLLFAALANGRSSISNLATGEDVQATRAALSALGVDVQVDTEVVTVSAGDITHLRAAD